MVFILYILGLILIYIYIGEGDGVACFFTPLIICPLEHRLTRYTLYVSIVLQEKVFKIKEKYFFEVLGTKNEFELHR